MKYICLLGASGSIGQQTIDVLYKNRESFTLLSFSVGHNTRKIAPILKKFPSVKSVYLIDTKKALRYQKKYPQIKFFSSSGCITTLIDSCKVDMVVNALVGFAGLLPTLHSIDKEIDVALANKESLVVGGELISKLLKHSKSKIYPIDSEHSALYRCLKVDDSNVKSMYLTASGGAFRDLSLEELKFVTKEDALKHPTWKMGEKITIDCATMVNKAFEVIEAHYLFGYDISKINIILHPQSLVHSFLEYEDGSIRAHISKPDMRDPIKFALFETKIPFNTSYFTSFDELKKSYQFKEFDILRYPLVRYAKEVIKNKGVYGAVFNASCEVAVNAFLKGYISFLDISKIIDFCMNDIENIKNINYNKLQRFDALTREKAWLLVSKRRMK